jgi:hypothetical protein
MVVRGLDHTPEVYTLNASSGMHFWKNWNFSKFCDFWTKRRSLTQWHIEKDAGTGQTCCEMVSQAQKYLQK